MEHNWYRFPIQIMSKTDYEIFDGNPPTDKLDPSWVDFRLDQIIGIRPYFEEDGTVSGTTLFTTAGTDFGVDLLPSEVRKILSYTPINKTSNA